MDVNTKKTYLKTRPYPIIKPLDLQGDLNPYRTTPRGEKPAPKNSKELKVSAFFVNFQDVIKKGLRDGVPNASGRYSEGVVLDTEKFLNQRDATNTNVQSEYSVYFTSPDYQKQILKDYIKFYAPDKENSSLITLIDDSDSFKTISSVLFSSGTLYYNKISEVLQKIVEYQGGIIDTAKVSQLVGDGYMQNNLDNNNNGVGTGGENNQNGNGGGSSATSNTNYLLIGIVILAGIFLLKRSKK
ncbi:MAG: hypothetical protein UHN41_06735 [Bacteroidales bacterium]|nr:hypothetical protein [Bacteroidales bacterium]